MTWGLKASRQIYLQTPLTSPTVSYYGHLTANYGSAIMSLVDDATGRPKRRPIFEPDRR